MNSRPAARTKPNNGDNSNALAIPAACDQSTPEVPSRPRSSALVMPTPMIDPIRVCELEAGRPKYQVPTFQMMAAINSANTMAKPAPLPTCRISSTGAVALGIVSLLPVELILQVGSGAGFAMVFALLIAAIIWNVGTWYFGLPASSSHTLIGSIMGVGITNQIMAGPTGTSGVDWSQAATVGKSLLLSPLVGFIAAALLLLLCK